VVGPAGLETLFPTAAARSRRHRIRCGACRRGAPRPTRRVVGWRRRWATVCRCTRAWAWGRRSLPRIATGGGDAVERLFPLHRRGRQLGGRRGAAEERRVQCAVRYLWRAVVGARDDGPIGLRRSDQVAGVEGVHPAAAGRLEEEYWENLSTKESAGLGSPLPMKRPRQHRGRTRQSVWRARWSPRRAGGDRIGRAGAVAGD
jgi:hypothetical protein